MLEPSLSSVRTAEAVNVPPSGYVCSAVAELDDVWVSVVTVLRLPSPKLKANFVICPSVSVPEAVKVTLSGAVPSDGFAVRVVHTGG